ncbi:MAG TPA: hypothetical protein DIU11_03485, partial [Pusillimonas sp.]|nr:hypothetical protein [Pusillimonas sp.]
MQPIQEADQEFAGNVKTRQNVARQSAKNTQVTADDIQSLEPIDEGFSPAPITKSSGFKPATNAPLSGLSREDIQALEPIDEGMTLAPSSEPVQQEDSSGIGGFLADEAKGLAGSAISATGSAVRQAGKIYEAGAPFRASALGESEVTTGNPLDSAADWLQDQGEEVSGSTSILRQLAKMNSTPDGDITDPSTWTFGDDPSIRGY